MRCYRARLKFIFPCAHTSLLHGGGSFEKWFKSNSLSRVVIEKLKAPSTFYDCRITFLSAARASFKVTWWLFVHILLSAAAFASLKETASGVSTLCMCSCQLGSSVFIKAKNDGVRKFSLRVQNVNAAKKTHSTLCLRSQVEMKLRKIVTKFGSRCGQLIKGSAREGGKEKKRHSISFYVHQQKRSLAVCFHYKFWLQLFSAVLKRHTQRKYKQTF